METDLNKRVCHALAARHAVRVENAVGPGTPDIAFVGGWIESKQIAFPKRHATIVQIPHYTWKQKGWHAAHEHAGGFVRVVVEDSRSGGLYIFTGQRAALHIGDCDKDQLLVRCNHYLGKWDANEFRNYITRELASCGRA